MSPILALVVETLVEHFHDFDEVLSERAILLIWLRIKRQISLTG